MDCSLPCSFVYGILQVGILEWVFIPFSNRIFPTQGLNLGLLHCRQVLYQLSHHPTNWTAIIPQKLYLPQEWKFWAPLHPSLGIWQKEDFQSSSFEGLSDLIAQLSLDCFPGGTSGKKLTYQCWEDPLEEHMATHSSILAWRIPWTEESGRLWSIGSQRVRHNWSNLACMP